MSGTVLLQANLTGSEIDPSTHEVPPLIDFIDWLDAQSTEPLTNIELEAAIGHNCTKRKAVSAVDPCARIKRPRLATGNQATPLHLTMDKRKRKMDDPNVHPNKRIHFTPTSQPQSQPNYEDEEETSRGIQLPIDIFSLSFQYLEELHIDELDYGADILALRHTCSSFLRFFKSYPKAYPIGQIGVYRHKQVMRQINQLRSTRKYTRRAYIARSCHNVLHCDPEYARRYLDGWAGARYMLRQINDDIWREHFTFVEIAKHFPEYVNDYDYNYAYFYLGGVYRAEVKRRKWAARARV